MKQIDRLILKEIVGPWVFGVAMFSTLLMAATYLNRIADYIVHGLPLSLVVKITLLLMPAMLVNSFAMAVLLAGLLSFGRLSGDSEIVALRAAGASMIRIIRPVMAFSFVIGVATFFFNNNVVPPAAAESQKLVLDIANKSQGVKGQPVSFPLVQDKKMMGQLMAQAFDISQSTLNGVTIVAYDKDLKPSVYLWCNTLEYIPDKTHQGHDKWHAKGGGSIIPADGGQITHFDEMWPQQVVQPTQSPEDIITLNNGDMSIYSMAQIQHQIDRGRRDKTLTSDHIHNLEYGYWNKISVAVAAFIFGALGAVLGIRNQRASTASGFALAIGIIFGYFALANFMNVWAMSGVLPAWLASFAPIIIGCVAAGVLMWRRNS